jgi:hypothetical protein
VKRAAPRLAALLLPLLPMLLASCQTQGPVERPLSTADARVASWLEGLSKSASRRQQMRAQARLSLEAPDLRFSRPQRLVVARPSSLRVEVLGLFGQIAAVLATEDGRYQFFDPAERTLEEGDVGAESLWRLARVDMTPEEAAGVLLGAPQLAPGLAAIGASQFEDGGVAVLLGADEAAGQQRFEFDALGRLRSAKRLGPDGGVSWAARFSDYRQLNDPSDESFAFRVELSFPRVDASAEIDFKKVELNPELPRDVFVLSVPGGVRTPGDR